MAMDQPLDKIELDSIRYPSELLKSFDAFVSNLRRNILEDARKGLQNNKLPNSVQSNFISRVVFHSSTHRGTRFV